MGLTTKGICTQIIGSIGIFRAHPEMQSENDCLVVLNHLIRKFSEPAMKEGLMKPVRSVRVTGDCKFKREHVVPVKVVMNKLLHWPDTTISAANVNKLEQFLLDQLLVVHITPEEDACLNRAGFQQKMPSDWDGVDRFARYKAAGIYENIDHGR